MAAYILRLVNLIGGPMLQKILLGAITVCAIAIAVLSLCVRCERTAKEEATNEAESLREALQTETRNREMLQRYAARSDEATASYSASVADASRAANKALADLAGLDAHDYEQDQRAAGDGGAMPLFLYRSDRLGVCIDAWDAICGPLMPAEATPDSPR